MPTKYTRGQAGLRPAKPLTPLATPVSYVFIHHSVTPVSADPFKTWRDVQAFHMLTRGYDDIAYTVAVTNGGALIEGRSERAAGGHTLGWNMRSLAICFLGNFDVDIPSEAALDAARWQITNWKARGLVTPEAQIWPHNYADTKGRFIRAGAGATACCGRNLIGRMDDLRRSLDAPTTNTNIGVVENMIAIRPNAKPITSGPLAGRWPMYRLHAESDTVLADNGETFKSPDGAVYGVPFVRLPKGHQQIVGLAIVGDALIVGAADGGTFAYAI